MLYMHNVRICQWSCVCAQPLCGPQNYQIKRKSEINRFGVNLKGNVDIR